jgi:RNA polymerase sigma factor (sigma-70 family)
MTSTRARTGALVLSRPLSPTPDPCLKSNPAFLLDLFQEQSTPLLKFLTSRLRDREDAAEIAQEAWLRMHRLEHPEQLSNPKAYLFQLASNLGIDLARRHALEQRVNRAERHVLSEGLPSAERAVAAEESIERVRAALQDLPGDCRQAFVLHRGRDMSYPDIAAQLGVSTSMVEKYIARALRHLRDSLSA